MARRVVPAPMPAWVEGHPKEREEWVLVLVAEQLPQPVLLEEQQEETAVPGLGGDLEYNGSNSRGSSSCDTAVREKRGP